MRGVSRVGAAIGVVAIVAALAANLSSYMFAIWFTLTIVLSIGALLAVSEGKRLALVSASRAQMGACLAYASATALCLSSTALAVVAAIAI